MSLTTVSTVTEACPNSARLPTANEAQRKQRRCRPSPLANKIPLNIIWPDNYHRQVYDHCSFPIISAALTRLNEVIGTSRRDKKGKHRRPYPRPFRRVTKIVALVATPNLQPRTNILTP